MNKTNFLLPVFVFICMSAFGQEQESVVIFEGRKVPFMQQKVLDLSFQNLKQVPVEALNQDIEVLILDNNEIEKLPTSIGNLKNLKVLSVINNKLCELNSAISFCENLELLYLSANKNLTDLPSLTTNEKIKVIDVIETGINDVPGWVESMDSLFYFKYTKINSTNP